jgi:hypothetical protein
MPCNRPENNARRSAKEACDVPSGHCEAAADIGCMLNWLSAIDWTGHNNPLMKVAAPVQRTVWQIAWRRAFLAFIMWALCSSD